MYIQTVLVQYRSNSSEMRYRPGHIYIISDGPKLVERVAEMNSFAAKGLFVYQVSNLCRKRKGVKGLGGSRR